MSRDLIREWENLSGPWIREAREGRNPTREGLLDEPVLMECGDLTGKRVLDCGCGEGRFCRRMLEMGASYVLGIDLCSRMIDAAAELQAEGADYILADVQEMRFLEDESFDLAVSYLNQCDLPDFQSNNSEVFRVLRPGGRFVVANLHPMRSAVGSWHRDENGDKSHVILDDYFSEGERHWRIMGVELTNFHRTLTSYVDGFLLCGFRLGRIVEPGVTDEVLRQYPELEDELRVPNFIIYRLEKP
jgi:SAM-dependent methyltransferase